MAEKCLVHDCLLAFIVNEMSAKDGDKLGIFRTERGILMFNDECMFACLHSE